MNYCTDDNRLLTVRESGAKGNRKFELVSYDTDDGSVSQKFTLGFRPLISDYHMMDCNKNYLALMDVLGNAYIYTYSYVDTDSDQDPNSNYSSNLQT